MLFPLNKIELCTAGKKDPRSYLHHVHLDAEGRRLLATDGHIAVVLPVQPDATDTSGPITLDCIKDARKQDYRMALNDAVVTLTNGAIHARPDAPLTVKIDTVIPAADGETIALDAELLYRLAQALVGKEQSHVRLYIPADSFSAIRVEPINGNGYGAIMPCRDYGKPA